MSANVNYSNRSLPPRPASAGSAQPVRPSPSVPLLRPIDLFRIQRKASPNTGARVEDLDPYAPVKLVDEEGACIIVATPSSSGRMVGALSTPAKRLPNASNQSISSAGALVVGPNVSVSTAAMTPLRPKRAHSAVLRASISNASLMLPSPVHGGALSSSPPPQVSSTSYHHRESPSYMATLKRDLASHGNKALSIDPRQVALLLLQQLGPIGVQQLESVVRGHTKASKERMLRQAREATVGLGGGIRGTLNQSKSKSGAFDTSGAVVSGADGASLNKVPVTSTTDEVVPQYMLPKNPLGEPRATLYTSKSKSKTIPEPGIDGDSFVVGALRCLAHSTALYGTSSMPWVRKCAIAADGSFIYSDLDVGAGGAMFLPPKQEQSTNIILQSKGRKGAQAVTQPEHRGGATTVPLANFIESGTLANDAVVLSSAGAAGSKGGGEERLDFLPDSVRVHGGVHFRGGDEYPFCLVGNGSVVVQREELIGRFIDYLSQSRYASAKGDSGGPYGMEEPRSTGKLANNKMPAKLSPMLLKVTSPTKSNKSASTSPAAVALATAEAMAQSLSMSASASGPFHRSSPASLSITNQGLPIGPVAPNMVPLASLAINPLLDPWVLPLALLLLYHEIDTNAANSVSWEAMTAYFGLVGNRHNSNLVKTKQAQQQRKLLLATAGGKKALSGEEAAMASSPSAQLLQELSDGAALAPQAIGAGAGAKRLAAKAVAMGAADVTPPLDASPPVHIGDWGPSSAGSNSADRYVPFQVHAAFSANTDRIISVTSNDDVLFLDAKSLAIRGSLPPLRAVGQAGTGEMSGAPHKTSDGSQSSMHIPGLLASRDESAVLKAQSERKMGSHLLNRTKDAGLSSAPVQHLSGTSFITALEHFVLPPRSGRLKSAFDMDDDDPDRRGDSSSEEEDEKGNTNNGYSDPLKGSSAAKSKASAGSGNKFGFSNNTEGVIALGTADSHLRLYHYHSNSLRTAQLSFEQPFGSPQTVLRWVPELNCLLTGAKSGCISRVVSRSATAAVAEASIAQSKQSKMKTFKSFSALQSDRVKETVDRLNNSMIRKQRTHLGDTLVGSEDGDPLGLSGSVKSLSSSHKVDLKKAGKEWYRDHSHSQETQKEKKKVLKKFASQSLVAEQEYFDQYFNERYHEKMVQRQIQTVKGARAAEARRRESLAQRNEYSGGGGGGGGLRSTSSPIDDDSHTEFLTWKATPVTFEVTAPITDMVYIPTKGLVAASTNTGSLAFLDVEHYQHQGAYPSLHLGTSEHPVGIYCLAHSADFEVVACGGSEPSPFFVFPGGNPIPLYNGGETHASAICTVEFLRGTSLFLSGDASGIVKLWDVRRMDCVSTVDTCKDIAAAYQRVTGRLSAEERARRYKNYAEELANQNIPGYKTEHERSRNRARPGTATVSTSSSSTKVAGSSESPTAMSLARDRYSTAQGSPALRYLKRAKTEEAYRLAMSQATLASQRGGGGGGGDSSDNGDVGGDAPTTPTEKDSAIANPTAAHIIRKPYRNIVKLQVNYYTGTIDIAGARSVQRFTHRFIVPLKDAHGQAGPNPNMHAKGKAVGLLPEGQFGAAAFATTEALLQKMHPQLFNSLSALKREMIVMRGVAERAGLTIRVPLRQNSIQAAIPTLAITAGPTAQATPSVTQQPDSDAATTPNPTIAASPAAATFGNFATANMGPIVAMKTVTVPSKLVDHSNRVSQQRRLAVMVEDQLVLNAATNITTTNANGLDVNGGTSEAATQITSIPKAADPNPALRDSVDEVTKRHTVTMSDSTVLPVHSNDSSKGRSGAEDFGNSKAYSQPSKRRSTARFQRDDETLIVAMTSNSLSVWNVRTGEFILKNGPLKVADLHRAHLQQLHNTHRHLLRQRELAAGRIAARMAGERDRSLLVGSHKSLQPTTVQTTSVRPTNSPNQNRSISANPLSKPPPLGGIHKGVAFKGIPPSPDSTVVESDDLSLGSRSAMGLAGGLGDFNSSTRSSSAPQGKRNSPDTSALGGAPPLTATTTASLLASRKIEAVLAKTHGPPPTLPSYYEHPRDFNRDRYSKSSRGGEEAFYDRKVEFLSMEVAYVGRRGDSHVRMMEDSASSAIAEENANAPSPPLLSGRGGGDGSSSQPPPMPTHRPIDTTSANLEGPTISTSMYDSPLNLVPHPNEDLILIVHAGTDCGRVIEIVIVLDWAKPNEKLLQVEGNMLPPGAFLAPHCITKCVGLASASNNRAKQQGSSNTNSSVGKSQPGAALPSVLLGSGALCKDDHPWVPYPITTIIKPRDFFVDDELELRRQIRQQERTMRKLRKATIEDIPKAEIERQLASEALQIATERRGKGSSVVGGAAPIGSPPNDFLQQSHPMLNSASSYVTGQYANAGVNITPQPRFMKVGDSSPVEDATPPALKGLGGGPVGEEGGSSPTLSLQKSREARAARRADAEREAKRLMAIENRATYQNSMLLQYNRGSVTAQAALAKSDAIHVNSVQRAFVGSLLELDYDKKLRGALDRRAHRNRLKAQAALLRHTMNENIQHFKQSGNAAGQLAAIASLERELSAIQASLNEEVLSSDSDKDGWKSDDDALLDSPSRKSPRGKEANPRRKLNTKQSKTYSMVKRPRNIVVACGVFPLLITEEKGGEANYYRNLLLNDSSSGSDKSNDSHDDSSEDDKTSTDDGKKTGAADYDQFTISGWGRRATKLGASETLLSAVAQRRRLTSGIISSGSAGTVEDISRIGSGPSDDSDALTAKASNLEDDDFALMAFKIANNVGAAAMENTTFSSTAVLDAGPADTPPTDAAFPSRSTLFRDYRRQVVYHEKVFDCTIRVGDGLDVRIPLPHEPCPLDNGDGGGGTVNAATVLPASRPLSASSSVNPTLLFSNRTLMSALDVADEHDKLKKKKGALTPSDEDNTFLYLMFATPMNTQVFIVLKREKMEQKSHRREGRLAKAPQGLQRLQRRMSLFDGGFTNVRTFFDEKEQKRTELFGSATGNNNGVDEGGSSMRGSMLMGGSNYDDILEQSASGFTFGKPLYEEPQSVAAVPHAAGAAYLPPISFGVFSSAQQKEAAKAAAKAKKRQDKQSLRHLGYHWVRVRIDIIRTMPDFADCIRSWSICINNAHTVLTADTSGGVQWSCYPNVEAAAPPAIETKKDGDEPLEIVASNSVTAKGARAPYPSPRGSPRGTSPQQTPRKRLAKDGKTSASSNLATAEAALSAHKKRRAKKTKVPNSFTPHSMHPVCMARFSAPQRPDATVPSVCVGAALLTRSVYAGPDVHTVPQRLYKDAAEGEYESVDRLLMLVTRSGLVGLYDAGKYHDEVLKGGDPVVAARRRGLAKTADNKQSHNSRPLSGAVSPITSPRSGPTSAPSTARPHTKSGGRSSAVSMPANVNIFDADMVLEQQPMGLSSGALPREMAPIRLTDHELSHMANRMGLSSDEFNLTQTGAAANAAGLPPTLTILSSFPVTLYGPSTATPYPPAMVQCFTVGPDPNMAGWSVTSFVHMPTQRLLVFGVAELVNKSSTGLQSGSVAANNNKVATAAADPNASVFTVANADDGEVPAQAQKGSSGGIGAGERLATLVFTHTYWGVPVSVVDVGAYYTQSYLTDLTRLLSGGGKGRGLGASANIVGGGSTTHFSTTAQMAASALRSPQNGNLSTGPYSVAASGFHSRSMMGAGASMFGTSAINASPPASSAQWTPRLANESTISILVCQTSEVTLISVLAERRKKLAAAVAAIEQLRKQQQQQRQQSTQGGSMLLPSSITDKPNYSAVGKGISKTPTSVGFGKGANQLAALTKIAAASNAVLSRRKRLEALGPHFRRLRLAHLCYIEGVVVLDGPKESDVPPPFGFDEEQSRWSYERPTSVGAALQGYADAVRAAAALAGPSNRRATSYFASSAIAPPMLMGAAESPSPSQVSLLPDELLVLTRYKPKPKIPLPSEQIGTTPARRSLSSAPSPALPLPATTAVTKGMGFFNKSPPTTTAPVVKQRNTTITFGSSAVADGDAEEDYEVHRTKRASISPAVSLVSRAVGNVTEPGSREGPSHSVMHVTVISAATAANSADPSYISTPKPTAGRKDGPLDDNANEEEAMMIGIQAITPISGVVQSTSRRLSELDGAAEVDDAMMSPMGPESSMLVRVLDTPSVSILDSGIRKGGVVADDVSVTTDAPGSWRRGRAMRSPPPSRVPMNTTVKSPRMDDTTDLLPTVDASHHQLSNKGHPSMTGKMVDILQYAKVTVDGEEVSNDEDIIIATQRQPPKVALVTEDPVLEVPPTAPAPANDDEVDVETLSVGRTKAALLHSDTVGQSTQGYKLLPDYYAPGLEGSVALNPSRFGADDAAAIRNAGLAQQRQEAEEKQRAKFGTVLATKRVGTRRPASMNTVGHVPPPTALTGSEGAAVPMTLTFNRDRLARLARVEVEGVRQREGLVPNTSFIAIRSATPTLESTLFDDSHTMSNSTDRPLDDLPRESYRVPTSLAGRVFRRSRSSTSAAGVAVGASSSTFLYTLPSSGNGSSVIASGIPRPSSALAVGQGISNRTTGSGGILNADRVPK